MWSGGCTPKRIDSRGSNKYSYAHVHNSMAHGSQKVETTQVSIDRWWINQLWSIHIIEYYSALKREEILTPATTWMGLEDIMLSETIQSQKENYCGISTARTRGTCCTGGGVHRTPNHPQPAGRPSQSLNPPWALAQEPTAPWASMCTAWHVTLSSAPERSQPPSSLTPALSSDPASVTAPTPCWTGQKCCSQTPCEATSQQRAGRRHPPPPGSPSQLRAPSLAPPLG